MPGAGYLDIGVWTSLSRQALIFNRRHTQHNPSDCSLAPGSEQMRHGKVSIGFGSKIFRRAESRKRGSMTGSSMLLGLPGVLMDPLPKSPSTIDCATSEVQSHLV